MDHSDWTGERALVTGGAGFIGSNLCERLLDLGASVTVLDDLSSGKLENLAFVRERKLTRRFKLIQGDIRDDRALRRALKGASAIFHMAALGSVVASVENPLHCNSINVEGSLRVLDAARRAGVKRIVVSSSASVYGNDPALPKRETMTPQPESPYASSKISMEHYAANYTALYGMNVAILRYFNVYGPKQDPHSIYAAAIPIFVHRLLSNERPVIFGDGEQTRDFVHVSDVVEANLRAACASHDACGHAINVARGERISVNRLIGLLSELLASPLQPLYAPERVGDVKHSVASVRLGREQLGFRAAVSLSKGLRASIGWYRQDFERRRGAS